jgi:hypothetical protein
MPEELRLLSNSTISEHFLGLRLLVFGDNQQVKYLKSKGTGALNQ